MKCYECHKTEHIQRNSLKSTSLTLQSKDESRKQIIDMIKNMIARFSFIENMKFVN
jgi:hypothetical protein